MNGNIINYRGHHFSLLGGSYLVNEGAKSDWSTSNLVFDEKYAKVLSNRNVKFKVVGGLDEICSSCKKITNLRMREEFCGYEGSEDIWAREGYGFSIGFILNIDQLKRRFEEFYKLTGAISPRELYLEGKTFSFKEKRFINSSNTNMVKIFSELRENTRYFSLID